MKRWAVLICTFTSAVVATWIAWRLVAPDVAFWESHGYTSGPELKFVVAAAVGGGVLGFLVSRRIFVGPRLSRVEWMIEMVPSGSVALLLGRLQGRGFSAAAEMLDELGESATAAKPEAPLAGVQLRLTLEGGARHACVVVRLGPRVDGQARALGFVEARDVEGGRHPRLAAEVICALDELHPGVLYKRSDSSLSLEPAAQLRAQLDG
jgi:hypothetical protein